MRAIEINPHPDLTVHARHRCCSPMCLARPPLEIDFSISRFLLLNQCRLTREAGRSSAETSFDGGDTTAINFCHHQLFFSFFIQVNV
jgi:hypothetical protein